MPHIYATEALNFVCVEFVLSISFT